MRFALSVALTAWEMASFAQMWIAGELLERCEAR